MTAGSGGPRRAAGALLVAAVRGSALPELDDAAWGHVVELAVGHRVVEAVHVALAPGQAPDSVRTALLAQRQAYALRELAFQPSLRLALGALQDAGVEALLLKGPVLGEVWYAPAAPRPHGDLDLLVRPRDLATAVAALQQLDGCALASRWSTLRRLGAGEVDLVLPGGTPLDLHWSLLFHPAWRRRMPLATEPLLERAVDVVVAGRAARTLCVTDTALHLALHAALGGGHLLGWYLDLRHVLAHDVDWDALVERTTAARAGLAVGHVLHRARTWFGLDVPPEVVPALRGEGRVWAAASDALDRLRPPAPGPRDRWQGRRFVRSGRHRTPDSAGVFVRDVARTSLHLTRSPAGDDRPADRDAYLGLVASQPA